MRKSLRQYCTGSSLKPMERTTRLGVRLALDEACPKHPESVLVLTEVSRQADPWLLYRARVPMVEKAKVPTLCDFWVNFCPIFSAQIKGRPNSGSIFFSLIFDYFFFQLASLNGEFLGFLGKFLSNIFCSNQGSARIWIYFLIFFSLILDFFFFQLASLNGEFLGYVLTYQPVESPNITSLYIRDESLKTQVIANHTCKLKIDICRPAKHSLLLTK